MSASAPVPASSPLSKLPSDYSNCCYTILSPCVQTVGDNVRFCDLSWSKDQFRYMCTCLAIILILGLIIGEFAKVGAIVGGSAVLTYIIYKAINRFNFCKDSSVAPIELGEPKPPLAVAVAPAAASAVVAVAVEGASVPDRGDRKG